MFPNRFDRAARLPRAVAPLLLLVLAGAAPSRARAAAENVGTTGASFLAVETGARALGLGGAYTAVPGGAEQLAWNPAALTGGAEIGASHTRLEDVWTYNWAGFASAPLVSGGRFGVTFATLSLAGLDGRSDDGSPTGAISSSAGVLGFTWSQEIAAGVVAGTTVKGAGESIGEATGLGVAADAGVHFRRGALALAAVGQNLGPAFVFDGAAAPLPRDLRLGAAVVPERERWLAALEVEMPYDFLTNLRAGLEVRPHEALALRAGYRLEFGPPESEPGDGLNFGAGTGFGGIALDYAFSSLPREIHPSHRISFAYRFGRAAKTVGPAAAPAARP